MTMKGGGGFNNGGGGVLTSKGLCPKNGPKICSYCKINFSPEESYDGLRGGGG